mmetsp:Transcript_24626/g.65033  ORF Transcript_24626/g.65033 Transcript_24626/m.65033 type:complete len:257 (-) Transcript_24626:48-818(-)
MDDALEQAKSGAQQPSFLQEVLTTVRKSLRENRVPAVFSFFLGVALLASYYGGGDSTRPTFVSLGDIQKQGGVLFSTATTCITAGLVPSLLQAALGQLPRPFLLHVAFNMALWAFIGGSVDRFYFFQALMFGDGADIGTVVKKVLFDQFVWNTLLCCPFLALVFRWRDHKFTFTAWRDVLQPRALVLADCCMLLTCWCTWIPGTSTVYSFPVELQMPAFNIIIMMYSSLVSLVSQRATAGGATAIEQASLPTTPQV